MESKRIAIVTYNAVDGACAAAMGLLKHPKAELWVTSASAIGRTFALIDEQKKPPQEIHVCGVGVYCDWEELARPAGSLRAKGARIFWHCGRGYLEKERESFERVATTVFEKAATNTEEIGRHFGVLDTSRAGEIAQLAGHDRYAAKAERPPSEKEGRWLDLLHAANAAYFKYQDSLAMDRAIRKLASGTMDSADERAIEVFRKTGTKYVLYGRSTKLRSLRRLIHKCAQYDDPVLITGETGVGKEHAAHLIHDGGNRVTGPFVSVNCAVFAGNAGLANSILFGHLPGAFTGALKKREGAFATAHGGTLFLDELGEMPLEVQSKLLRVLDDGDVIPEGADKPERTVSVRIIAATNRDLPAMIRKGQFRADLFHRLATLRIAIPPLRERKEDIEAIIENALRELPDRVPRRALTDRECALLRSYDWPGNVRQLTTLLKQVMYLERSVAEVLAEEKALGALSAQPEEPADPFLPQTADAVRPLDDIRRAYARKAFDLHHGNWTATAKALGVAQNTLRGLLTG